MKNRTVKDTLAKVKPEKGREEFLKENQNQFAKPGNTKCHLHPIPMCSLKPFEPVARNK